MIIELNILYIKFLYWNWCKNWDFFQNLTFFRHRNAGGGGQKSIFLKKNYISMILISIRNFSQSFNCFRKKVVFLGRPNAHTHSLTLILTLILSHTHTPFSSGGGWTCLTWAPPPTWAGPRWPEQVQGFSNITVILSAIT